MAIIIPQEVEVAHVEIGLNKSCIFRISRHCVTLTSASDVFVQIWTGLRHSCRSLSPLSWTNDNIWCWYNGELSQILWWKLLLHLQSTNISFIASVNRPVCTEEDTTASPRTESGGRTSLLNSETGWSMDAAGQVMRSINLGNVIMITSCLHHNLSSRN